MVETKESVIRERSSPIRKRLLEAAEHCLLKNGYAEFSTRAVAESAKTQLSQIHYHFGSKQGLVLALFEYQNQKLLRRQETLIGRDAPLSERWMEACDYLEEDLRSGYVRVLQEIIAAGYSDRRVAAAARSALVGWFRLLTQMGEEIRSMMKGSKRMKGDEVACLIGAAFLGAESMILIDMDVPIRSALRGVGRALQYLERHGSTGGRSAR